MGFTTWPSDCTALAVEETWDRVQTNGDLTCVTLIGGLPWPEAFAGTPYPPEVEAELLDLARRTDTDQPLLLQVSSLDGLRGDVAEYWGAQHGMPRPAPWDGYDFGDPEIAVAYSAWLLDLVQRLEPDYLVYGMEVSEYLLNQPAHWAEFLGFTQAVASTVRASFPDLPLGLSVVLSEPDSLAMDTLRARIPDLHPYIDHLAASVYPYVFQGLGAGGGDPDNLHVEWSRSISELAGSLPVAIAETGFIAQALDVNGMPLVPASESWQAEYVSRLLREAQSLDALYVGWFVSMDLDAMWTNCLGQDDLSRIWRDTGLSDELGQGRPALSVWERWRERPVQDGLFEYAFDKDGPGPVSFSGQTPFFDATHLPADPDVVVAGDQFLMYLTLPSTSSTNPLVTGAAVSADGKHFTFVRTEDNPVIELTETYESLGIETVALVPSGGGVALYYTTYESGQPFVSKICRAHSSDGLNFIKDGVVLDATLPWELPWTGPGGDVFGGLLEQSIVWDPDLARYTVLYNTFGLINGEWTLPVGRATSTDGLVWAKDPEPVIPRPDLDAAWDRKAVVHPDLLLVDGLWIMAYFAADLSLDAGGYVTTPGTIRIAFSDDGASWRAAPENVAIAPEGSGWESHTTFAPSLVLGPDGEMVHLFYWGVGGTESAQTWDIGHATKRVDELRALGRDLLDRECD